MSQQAPDPRETVRALQILASMLAPDEPVSIPVTRATVAALGTVAIGALRTMAVMSGAGPDDGTAITEWVRTWLEETAEGYDMHVRLEEIAAEYQAPRPGTRIQRRPVRTAAVVPQGTVVMIDAAVADVFTLLLDRPVTELARIWGIRDGQHVRLQVMQDGEGGRQLRYRSELLAPTLSQPPEIALEPGAVTELTFAKCGRFYRPVKVTR